MKHKWIVEEDDIHTISQLYEKQGSNPFVINRIKRNINGHYGTITRDSIWKQIVMCLLTTQQRSGPDSPISQFGRITPFPLDYVNCKKLTENKIISILDKHAGIRRKNKIAGELTTNLSWLESNGWDLLISVIHKIETLKTQSIEREAALFVMENLKGFGPKQSRNLLQSLGITQYEIPLDSRLMDWINSNLSFPIQLRAAGLSDINFYNFVMDGIIELCNVANIKPCVFDALVFSSFDNNWTEENAGELF